MGRSYGLRPDRVERGTASTSALLVNAQGKHSHLRTFPLSTNTTPVPGRTKKTKTTAARPLKARYRTSDDGWLSVSEAAEQGYGPNSTLRLYHRQGLLEGEKIDGKLRLTRESLDALVRPAQGPPRKDPADRLLANIQRAIDAAPPLTDDVRARIVALIEGA